MQLTICLHYFYLYLDIDECFVSSHNCSVGETCINTEGSFTCQVTCSLGYTGNGSVCTGKCARVIKIRGR